MGSKKNKYITQKLTDNVSMVKLAVNVSPVNKVDVSKRIITIGRKNDWFKYLLDLYAGSPAHGAIVNGKARYLSGVSIKPTEPNPLAEAWLKQIDAHKLVKRLDLDTVISGNEFILAHPNIIGQPVELIHLEFAKCRISECYTQVAYSEDWDDLHRNPPTFYPIWVEDICESAIMVHKRYSPSAKKIESAYGKTEYEQGILSIDTDWEINTFRNSLVKNNFSVGTIITIFSGKIPKAKQDEITNEILGEGAGTSNGGKTIVTFANQGDKGAEIANVNSNDLDKQYAEVSEASTQNILVAHGVGGALFKVKVGDTAWTRSDLVEAHELFLNEYVIPNQQPRLNWLSKMFKLRTGQECKFEIEQVENIGLELPLDNQTVVSALNAKNPNIITDYIIKKYNITIPEVLGANGLPITPTNPAVQESAALINGNLKGLSASENADILRVVRDHAKGRAGMNDVMAIHRLESYGIATQKAKEMLGIDDATVHQEAHDKYSQFLTLFSKYAHDINLEDEVLDVDYNVNFADNTPNELNNSVLNELKENPELTEDELAKKLGATKAAIASAITWLIAKKLLSGSSGKFKPKETTKTEIYTEYTYQLRPELKGQKKLLPTSHEFCVDMVALTANKALSFEAIDNMTNEFGENAWDFRGGFTTQKGTGEVKPWCRHVWQGQTKIRKVKI